MAAHTPPLAPRALRSFAPALMVLATGAFAGALVIVSRPAVALVFPTTAAVIALALLVRWLAGAYDDAPAARRVMVWTLGAFAVHLAVGLAIFASPRLTGYFGGDATTYNLGAIGILQHWRGAGPMPVLPAGKNGFYYMLAGVYWLFGTQPAAGMAIDAALAAAMIPLLYDATRRLFGPAAAGSIPPIVTLLPGFLLWGSQLLREAGVYFLTAVCIACAVRLRQRTAVAPIVTLAVAAALLVTWRADVGLIVAGGLVVGMALGRGRGAGGFVSGAGAAALVLAFVVGGGLGYSGYHFVTHASLGQLNGIRANSSQSAASGYLANANIATPTHAASYLPLGWTYFTIGPFPWQIHGGRQLYGLPDSFAWWFLLPSLWRGLRSMWRTDGLGAALLVLPAVALSAVLSLLIANFGTTVRERMQVIVVLAPLLALGWSLRRKRQRPGREIAAEASRAMPDRGARHR